MASLCMLLLSLLAFGKSQLTAKLPNIVFMLTDDLGWNSMYHNTEDITPTLDAMSKTSLQLESFYVYKYCAPTRASFLTGRFPYKLVATRENLNPPSLPVGTNLGYTMIAKKLQQASTPYISYQVGKWHQGIFAPEYTPLGRGFNKSYGFLSGGENHYNQRDFETCPHASFPAVDLYDSDKPAWGKNGTYNGYAFTNMAMEYITQHVKNHPDNPFFLYFALHNTHAPVQAPEDIVAMYHFNQTFRNVFDAMTTVVDQSVKNVTDTLKSLNIWDNTLFIWTTDNGAPVNLGGSNYPLRGSKATNFEGGTHVPAIVTGGILPSKMAGKTLNGLIHICDWYATFCHLAGGLNPHDDNPDAPAPIDSINMWPYLSGQEEKSPRTIIVHDHRMYTGTTQGAIRKGQYKLIKMNESDASWYGQFSPNETWNASLQNIYACSVKTPCLFDIENDLTEHHDLSQELPDVVANLTELFYSYDNDYHPPNEPPPNQESEYCNAINKNKGFVAPWNLTLSKQEL